MSLYTSDSVISKTWINAGIHSCTVGHWRWCVVLMPVVCLCAQEEYEYLYKAMLSLIGNRECGLSPLHMDTNGVVVMADESDPAESMESLVWGHSHGHLICKKSANFSEAFFARLLIKWITLLLFILIKVFWYLCFCPLFLYVFKCYPAERLHLFLSWREEEAALSGLH